uniref:PHM7_cyt domain-containing protein n=1 Tax=Caenorhabditis tropicalis TaxID=1561998 RepID=A0A1I7V1J9_9PELO
MSINPALLEMDPTLLLQLAMGNVPSTSPSSSSSSSSTTQTEQPEAPLDLSASSEAAPQPVIPNPLTIRIDYAHGKWELQHFANYSTILRFDMDYYRSRKRLLEHFREQGDLHRGMDEVINNADSLVIETKKKLDENEEELRMKSLRFEAWKFANLVPIVRSGLLGEEDSMRHWSKYAKMNRHSGVALLATYENRYFHLFGQKTRWRHFRKPYFFMIYVLIPFMFVPPFFNVPDQENARLQVFASIPCLPKFVFDDRKMYVLSVDFEIPVICVACALIFMATSFIIFLSLTFWNICVGDAWAASRQTMALQKSFTKGVTVQTIYEFFILFIPVVTVPFHDHHLVPQPNYQQYMFSYSIPKWNRIHYHHAICS